VGGDPASGEVGVGTRAGVGRGEVVDEELIGPGAAEGVDRAADGGDGVGGVRCGSGVGFEGGRSVRGHGRTDVLALGGHQGLQCAEFGEGVGQVLHVRPRDEDLRQRPGREDLLPAPAAVL